MNEKTLERIASALERIATAIEVRVPEKPAPNYRQDLKHFPTFDWNKIAVEVEKSDRYGAATVIWQGKRFVRRSPDNAYGAAVFFTRCTGKDEQGRNQYERLITFTPVDEIKVKAISREAETAISY